MTMLATSTGAMLLKVVYSSVVASVAGSALFAFAIASLIRARDLRRLSRNGGATAYTVVAVGVLVICIAAVGYALVLVGQKN